MKTPSIIHIITYTYIYVVSSGMVLYTLQRNYEFYQSADITIPQIPRSVVKVTVLDWLVSLYQDKTSFDSPDMIHSPKVQNSRLNYQGS